MGTVLLMMASTAAADGELVALTPSLDFGRAVVGSGTYTRFVEVYNGTTSTVQVVSPRPAMFGEFTVVDGGDCPVAPPMAAPGDPALAPGATCKMAVEYTPMTIGPQSGNLGIGFCDVTNVTLATCPVPAVLIVEFPATGSGVPASTLTADATTLSFGSVPQQSVGAPQTVTLTNGSEPISIGGLSKSGAAAGDFLIANDGCTGANLAPHGTCTFDVRFAPSQTGERDATIGMSGTLGDTYPTLALSGTGGPQPSGTPSQTGPAGPMGSPAPQGPAGRVEIVTCRTRPKTGRGNHKIAVTGCKLRLVSSPAKFTITGSADRATIRRGARVYATGSSSSTAGGLLLVLHGVRQVRAGVYTLTVRHGAGRGHVVRRLQIRIR